MDSLFESCEILDPNGTVGNLTFGADVVLEGQNVTIVEERTEYIFLYVLAGVVPVFIVLFLLFRRFYRRRYNKLRRQTMDAVSRAVQAEESMRRQTIMMVKQAPSAPGMLVRSGTRALSRQGTSTFRRQGTMPMIPSALLRRRSVRNLSGAMPWEDRVPVQRTATSKLESNANEAVVFARANQEREKRADAAKARLELQRAGLNPHGLRRQASVSWSMVIPKGAARVIPKAPRKKRQTMLVEGPADTAAASAAQKRIRVYRAPDEGMLTSASAAAIRTSPALDASSPKPRARANVEEQESEVGLAASEAKLEERAEALNKREHKLFARELTIQAMEEELGALRAAMKSAEKEMDSPRTAAAAAHPVAKLTSKAVASPVSSSKAQVSPSSAFQLFVLPLSGKVLSLDVQPTAKVDVIHRIVEERQGIPPGQQCLLFDHELSVAIRERAPLDHALLARCLRSQQPLDKSGADVAGSALQLFGDESIASYKGLGHMSTIHLVPALPPGPPPPTPDLPLAKLNPSKWQASFDTLRFDVKSARQCAEIAKAEAEGAQDARMKAENKAAQAVAEAEATATRASEKAAADGKEIERLTAEISRMQVELQAAQAAQAAQVAAAEHQQRALRAESSPVLERTKTKRYLQQTVKMIEIETETKTNADGSVEVRELPPVVTEQHGTHTDVLHTEEMRAVTILVDGATQTEASDNEPPRPSADSPVPAPPQVARAPPQLRSGAEGPSVGSGSSQRQQRQPRQQQPDEAIHEEEPQEKETKRLELEALRQQNLELKEEVERLRAAPTPEARQADSNELDDFRKEMQADRAALADLRQQNAELMAKLQVARAPPQLRSGAEGPSVGSGSSQRLQRQPRQQHPDAAIQEENTEELQEGHGPPHATGAALASEDIAQTSGRAGVLPIRTEAGCDTASSRSSHPAQASSSPETEKAELETLRQKNAELTEEVVRLSSQLTPDAQDKAQALRRSAAALPQPSVQRHAHQRAKRSGAASPLLEAVEAPVPASVEMLDSSHVAAIESIVVPAPKVERIPAATQTAENPIPAAAQTAEVSSQTDESRIADDAPGGADAEAEALQAQLVDELRAAKLEALVGDTEPEQADARERARRLEAQLAEMENALSKAREERAALKLKAAAAGAVASKARQERAARELAPAEAAGETLQIEPNDAAAKGKSTIIPALIFEAAPEEALETVRAAAPGAITHTTSETETALEAASAKDTAYPDMKALLSENEALKKNVEVLKTEIQQLKAAGRQELDIELDQSSNVAPAFSDQASAMPPTGEVETTLSAKELAERAEQEAHEKEAKEAQRTHVNLLRSRATMKMLLAEKVRGNAAVGVKLRRKRFVFVSWARWSSARQLARARGQDPDLQDRLADTILAHGMPRQEKQVSAPAVAVASPPVLAAAVASTQTNFYAVGVSLSAAEIQTDSIPSASMKTQTDSIPSASVQTQTASIPSASMKTQTAAPPLPRTTETQTEEATSEAPPIPALLPHPHNQKLHVRSGAQASTAALGSTQRQQRQTRQQPGAAREEAEEEEEGKEYVPRSATEPDLEKPSSASEPPIEAESSAQALPSTSEGAPSTSDGAKLDMRSRGKQRAPLQQQQSTCASSKRTERPSPRSEASAVIHAVCSSRMPRSREAASAKSVGTGQSVRAQRSLPRSEAGSLAASKEPMIGQSEGETPAAAPVSAVAPDANEMSPWLAPNEKPNPTTSATITPQQRHRQQARVRKPKVAASTSGAARAYGSRTPRRRAFLPIAEEEASAAQIDNESQGVEETETEDDANDTLARVTAWVEDSAPDASCEHTLLALISVDTPPDTSGLDPPLHLVFVVDNSGSMGGEKLAQLKQALAFLVRSGLRACDRVGLVRFDEKVETLHDMVECDAQGKADVLQTIDKMEAKGKTNLSAGLIAGLKLLGKSHLEQRGASQAGVPSNSQRVLLFFSDDNPNRGITSERQLLSLTRDVIEHVDDDDSLQAARSEAACVEASGQAGEMSKPEFLAMDSLAHGVLEHGGVKPPRIFTFGLGRDHRVDRLRHLADVCEGEYHAIHSSQEAARSVMATLGSMRREAASGAKLVLESMPDVCTLGPPIQGVGGFPYSMSEMHIDGAHTRCEITLGSLYWGSHGGNAQPADATSGHRSGLQLLVQLHLPSMDALHASEQPVLGLRATLSYSPASHSRLAPPEQATAHLFLSRPPARSDTTTPLYPILPRHLSAVSIDVTKRGGSGGLRAALAIDEATRLAETGRFDLARSALEQAGRPSTSATLGSSTSRSTREIGWALEDGNAGGVGRASSRQGTEGLSGGRTGSSAGGAIGAVGRTRLQAGLRAGTSLVKRMTGRLSVAQRESLPRAFSPRNESRGSLTDTTESQTPRRHPALVAAAAAPAPPAMTNFLVSSYQPVSVGSVSSAYGILPPLAVRSSSRGIAHDRRGSSGTPATPSQLPMAWPSPRAQSRERPDADNVDARAQ